MVVPTLVYCFDRASDPNGRVVAHPLVVDGGITGAWNSPMVVVVSVLGSKAVSTSAIPDSSTPC
jgi:hypothetical protein